jgi:hypothetical protein
MPSDTMTMAEFTRAQQAEEIAPMTAGQWHRNVTAFIYHSGERPEPNP